MHLRRLFALVGAHVVCVRDPMPSIGPPPDLVGVTDRGNPTYKRVTTICSAPDMILWKMWWHERAISPVCRETAGERPAWPFEPGT